MKLKTTPITKNNIDTEKNQHSAQGIQKNGKEERKTAEDIVNDIVDNIDNNKEEQNIDNTSNSGYNNEKWQHYKMTATDSEPIYKDEIPGGEKNVGGNDNLKIDKTQIGDEPISKEDLNGDEKEENNEVNPAVDLVNRMDNLYQSENS